MGQITVRKLDDELIRRLKARAAANNRSAEAEVRSIIEAAVGKPAAGNAEAAWEEMERLRKELEGRWTGDSTELIREGRDYLTRKYE